VFRTLTVLALRETQSSVLSPQSYGSDSLSSIVETSSAAPKAKSLRNQWE